MVDVGVRAVHSRLCTLRAQALRVGTSAQGHEADVLAKYANNIPLSSQSLFGGGLKVVVATAASAAWDYAAMAEGFAQAGLYSPKPPGVRRVTRERLRFPAVLSCQEAPGPLPARRRNQPTSVPRKRTLKSSTGPKSSVSQKPQQKDRPKGGKSSKT